MGNKMLFTDGSVHPKVKIGYGAYLVVDGTEPDIDSLKAGIKVKRFENTTSSKLELQTLVWALGEIQTVDQKVEIYTDSQTIIGLPERRMRLEQNNYYSKHNKLLHNHELYRAIYKLTDQLDCRFIKVRGHLASSLKKDIDHYFTLVDRASRKALRSAGL